MVSFIKSFIEVSFFFFFNVDDVLGISISKYKWWRILVKLWDVYRHLLFLNWNWSICCPKSCYFHFALNSSITLAKWSVKDIGLDLSLLDGLVLGIGTTIAAVKGRVDHASQWLCKFHGELTDEPCRDAIWALKGLEVDYATLLRVNTCNWAVSWIFALSCITRIFAIQARRVTLFMSFNSYELVTLFFPLTHDLPSQM